MWVSKKRKDKKIYDFSFNRNQAKVSLSTVYKGKKKISQKKFLRKRESWGLNKKNEKKAFNCSRYGD